MKGGGGNSWTVAAADNSLNMYETWDVLSGGQQVMHITANPCLLLTTSSPSVHFSIDPTSKLPEGLF